MFCAHTWKPWYFKGRKNDDDKFEECRVCGAIRTVQKHPKNIALMNEYNREYFEKLGNIRDGIPWHKGHTLAHKKYLDMLSGGIVYYVGCGIGQFIPYLLPRSTKIWAWDTSEWVQKYLDEVYGAAGVMIMPPPCANSIIASHVLEHIKNADEVFREWVDLLLPGARLYIEVPDGSLDPYVQDHWWHFTPSAIKEWMTLAGLTIELMDVVPCTHHGDHKDEFIHIIGKKR